MASASKSVPIRSLSSKIFDQGWVASLVVGILLLSLTYTSLWGIVFAFISMVVLLVTFCKFSGQPGGESISAPLNRTACLVGYVIGTFCLACSLYWTFRVPLAKAMPGHIVEFINEHLWSAELNGGARIIEVPPFPGFDSGSLFGQKTAENIKIAEAHDLVGLIVNEALTHVDYTTKMVGIILIAMFAGVLLIHAFAQHIGRAIANVRDRDAR
jgi:hypothetical protein